MNRASASPLRSSWAELRREAARGLALRGLVELEWRRRFALWAAWFYATSVFLVYAVAIWFSTGAGRNGSVHASLRSALLALSLGVGAPAALSAARAFAEHDQGSALLALALQRGHSRSALQRARIWAAARRIGRLIASPALLLVLLALARGATFAWAGTVALAVVIYAAVLGTGLALLARFAAELAPRHARAMLAALVAVPWLASQVFPSVPSVPSAVAVLLGRLLEFGARLA